MIHGELQDLGIYTIIFIFTAVMSYTIITECMGWRKNK